MSTVYVPVAGFYRLLVFVRALAADEARRFWHFGLYSNVLGRQNNVHREALTSA
jgi:hypothetical protein